MSPRSRKHGQSESESSSSSQQEAEFQFGYLYRTVEDYINALAGKEGYPYSFADIAHRLGTTLTREALRQQLRHSELVPQVRGTSWEGRTAGAAQDMDVAARSRRTLSVRARKAIAKAQRERWARFKAAKEAKGTLDTSDQDKLRARWRKAKKKSRAGIKMPPSQRSATAKNMKGFWAKMTPAERSAEMIRRRKVAAAKAKKEGRTAFSRELVEIAENRPARVNGAAS